MIYPTRTAIFCAAAGVPVTLLVALLLPGRWYAALAWPVAVLLACLADALRGAGPGQATLRLVLPKTASVGAQVDGQAMIAIPGIPRAQLLLDTGPLLTQRDEDLWVDLPGGKGAAAIPLRTTRRGTARVARGWLRWKGPLGLVWKQRIVPLDAIIAILPDIRPVQDRGAQIFSVTPCKA